VRPSTPCDALLLDFGGTLDSDGEHWSTQLARAFATARLDVDRDALDKAFLAADRELSTLTTVGELGLEAHVTEQARRMLDHLALSDRGRAEQIGALFAERAGVHLRRSVELLRAARGRRRLALVSNFTPNLERIVREAGLRELFDAVVCSAVEGVCKPEAAIFQLALQRLGASPSSAAMIGDSLASDIAPAKAIGLTTIWIRGDRVFVPADASTADHVVGSLGEALAVLDRGAP
jgi:HAD superfamily hydrolase (TIGR01509 family)